MCVFFNLLLDALTYHCPVTPQCTSDKLGPVSLTYQTKRRPINGWQIELHNRSRYSKFRKTISIPEVILQSTFSRTVNKNEWMLTAITPQQVTLMKKRVVHFIAESLLYSAVSLIRFKNMRENMRENIPFPRACHILMVKNNGS